MSRFNGILFSFARERRFANDFHQPRAWTYAGCKHPRICCDLLLLLMFNQTMLRTGNNNHFSCLWKWNFHGCSDDCWAESMSIMKKNTPILSWYTTNMMLKSFSLLFIPSVLKWKKRGANFPSQNEKLLTPFGVQSNWGSRRRSKKLGWHVWICTFFCGARAEFSR